MLNHYTNYEAAFANELPGLNGLRYICRQFRWAVQYPEQRAPPE